jgi:hypothetical protein
MAAITPVDPAAPAPILAPREQRDNANRAAAEFGAALTHRERVEQKPRVDPAARAASKRQIDRDRRDDDAEDGKSKRPGSRVDIRV